MPLLTPGELKPSNAPSAAKPPRASAPRPEDAPKAALARESAALRVVRSATPGRLRLRAIGLRRRRDVASWLRAAADRSPALRAAELRLATGSVVVSYDSRISMEEAHRAFLDLFELPDRTGRKRRAAARRDAPERRARKIPRSAGATEPDPKWHALSRSALLTAAGADPETGLPLTEARDRLARFGGNIAPMQKPPSPLELLARQFKGAPVLMLVGSSIVSLGAGGVADALATLAVVLVNGVLGFVTEGEAERRIHSIMDGSESTVRTLREGVWREISSKELVPGDVVELRAGRQTPADARLLSTQRLTIDESALTGESLPSEKQSDAIPGPDAPIGARPNMAFAGTIVSEGVAKAVVLETGARTEAAKIQALSAVSGRPQAPVERGLEQLGERLAWASLAACGVFVGVGLLRGYPMSTMLKDALALAVAAVPEGLPMVATSTLSHGVNRMEKKGILIRQIGVVETLGALQTLCLDKTGTLTENRMAVAAAVAGDREVALTDVEALAPLAEIAALNNDDGACDVDIANEAPISSPTERALTEFARGAGLRTPLLRAERPRIETVERAIGRPWMTTRHAGAEALLTVKGAPEAILARCSHVLTDGETRLIRPEDRARIMAENDRIAALPSRVLGLARARGPAVDDVETTDPTDLTFVGLIGMVDPIRPSAPAFIRALHRAGIETILITGDQAATASVIARELDLSHGAPLKVVDSSNLAQMAPALLQALARDAHVFARVSSQDKLAIIKALQASGRVVGMTGDGVNDGPALNAADVGVAMGASGADLARDVANVVIRDDELSTLVEAISQGRSVYRNIRRSLEFLITTNISEILVSIVEALHGPGELETPMELLWINLATDVLPGLGLALAEPDNDAMTQPPRAADEPVIPREDMRRMALDSVVIAGSALTSHFIGLSRYGAGPQTRGMTFISLSLGQLLYTLVCQRRDPRHLRPDALLENRTLDLALLASSALATAPFFIPPLRRLLGVEPVGRVDTAIALGCAAIPFASVLARRGLSLELTPSKEI